MYAPLRADPSGHRHLMLGVAPGGAALLTVLDELRKLSPEGLTRTQLLYADRGSGVPGAIGKDTAASAARGTALATLVAAGVADARGFQTTDALLAAYRDVLEHSVMGLRVYVAGPESLLGLAIQIALEFDLNPDEIRAQVAGSLARRVRCVHCRATSEDVHTNIVACSGCGRWLFVRDHYSRRLAAYMGVMVDAELPGERPQIHEAFP